MMFCKQHLPGEDATAVLENEDGEEFEIKYIANKTGLSAGWRKFVTGNKLIEGDVLVFQLIGPCRFKVTGISLMIWFDYQDVGMDYVLLVFDLCHIVMKG